MKTFGMAWRRLMGAAAMGIAMLLLPVAASAHASAEHHRIAVNETVEPAFAGCAHDCLAPTAGYGLHCDLSPLPPLADGATQTRSHDRTAAPATSRQLFMAQAHPAFTAPSARIPTVAPPGYILFGNFRS